MTEAHMLLLHKNTRSSTAALGARWTLHGSCEARHGSEWQLRPLTAPRAGERSRKHTGGWPLSRGAPRQ